MDVSETNYHPLSQTEYFRNFINTQVAEFSKSLSTVGGWLPSTSFTSQSFSSYKVTRHLEIPLDDVERSKFLAKRQRRIERSSAAICKQLGWNFDNIPTSDEYKTHPETIAFDNSPFKIVYEDSPANSINVDNNQCQVPVNGSFQSSETSSHVERHEAYETQGTVVSAQNKPILEQSRSIETAQTTESIETAKRTGSDSVIEPQVGEQLPTSTPSDDAPSIVDQGQQSMPSEHAPANDEAAQEDQTPQSKDATPTTEDGELADGAKRKHKHTKEERRAKKEKKDKRKKAKLDASDSSL